MGKVVADEDRISDPGENAARSVPEAVELDPPEPGDLASSLTPPAESRGVEPSTPAIAKDVVVLIDELIPRPKPRQRSQWRVGQRHVAVPAVFGFGFHIRREVPAHEESARSKVDFGPAERQQFTDTDAGLEEDPEGFGVLVVLGGPRGSSSSLTACVGRCSPRSHTHGRAPRPPRPRSSRASPAGPPRKSRGFLLPKLGPPKAKSGSNGPRH